MTVWVERSERGNPLPKGQPLPAELATLQLTTNNEQRMEKFRFLNWEVL